MITAPGAPVVFGGAGDGDPRRDEQARLRMSDRIGATRWAWMHQVHGVTVLRATAPGLLGDADAAFTTDTGLALAVGTADCFPVALYGPGGVGIAHAGWRGAAAGVVAALRAAMTAAGAAPVGAAIGPGIRSCCFEVGPEVAARLADFRSTTTWGTPSVDLVGAITAALSGLTVWDSGLCTRSDPGFHSFRRDPAAGRQVGVVWLPD